MLGPCTALSSLPYSLTASVNQPVGYTSVDMLRRNGDDNGHIVAGGSRLDLKFRRSKCKSMIPPWLVS